MPIPKKLIKFLSPVKYESLEHRTVYTAFDKAQTLGVPEKIVGKTLFLKIDGELAIVLISASQILDKAKLKQLINTWRKKAKQKAVKEIDFASETLMKNKLIGVKVGAVPPFGSLWKIPTFIDKSLLKNPKIIVSAGDYDVSIKISPKLFKKLIPHLIIGNFSKPR